MTYRSLRPLLLLTLLALLTACGTSKRQPQLQGEETTVRVDNRNFLDMTIYVLRGSQRVRLGLVNGVSTQIFRIPDNLIFGASSLRFLADPVGGNATPVSQEITIISGDQVQLIIPNR